MSAARRYCEAIASMMAPHGGRPTEEFLLECAEHFTPAPLARDIPLMKVKQCFSNAYTLLTRSPGLRYCEGIAVNHIPCWHAWCVDADGRVVDNTWRPRSGPQVLAREYFGVVIPVDVLQRAMVRTRVYGALFDQQTIAELRDRRIR